MPGLRADLHAHTHASADCRTSVRRLLRAAHAAGLNVLAITDHDTVAAHDEAFRLAPAFGIQIIPGVEITTDGGTHVVAYFVRSLPPSNKLPDVLKWIQKQGGVSCLPHLYRSDTGLLYNHEQKGQFTKAEVTRILNQVDLIEGLNFKSAFRGEPDGCALADTHAKVLLANTDAHYDLEVGKAFTEFAVPSTQPLTPEILKHAARTLWIHPITTLIPKQNTNLPLSGYEPAESQVRRWKRWFGPFIPLIGNLLYSWQDYARYRAKKHQINTLLTQSPEPKLYGGRG